MSADVTDRQRRILGRLVAEYIEQGEPVSSAWLADHSALGLSPATVRNILARLEEQGFLKQPHTSAGRVPTDSGYRLYVDWLLGSRRPVRTSPDVEARLRRPGTVGDLMHAASQELSRATHHIGFALTSGHAPTRLHHIDFVNLEGHRVLVIVVTTAGQIIHKVIDAPERYSVVALTEAANYINAEFTGLTLDEVRTAVIGRLHRERALYDALMARALELARTSLAEVTAEDTLHVQGASSIFDELVTSAAEHATLTVETARTLVQLIEEKHRLVALLTRYMEAAGLTVVIGAEHTAPDLQSFSVVATTIGDGGTVGVIGPTRMRYQRTISVVDGVGQAVKRVLEGQ